MYIKCVWGCVVIMFVMKTKSDVYNIKQDKTILNNATTCVNTQWQRRSRAK